MCALMGDFKVPMMGVNISPLSTYFFAFVQVSTWNFKESIDVDA